MVLSHLQKDIPASALYYTRPLEGPSVEVTVLPREVDENGHVLCVCVCVVYGTAKSFNTTVSYVY